MMREEKIRSKIFLYKIRITYHKNQRHVLLQAIKRNVIAVTRYEEWNLGLFFPIITESGPRFVIIV
jgi:hypothetical protein